MRLMRQTKMEDNRNKGFTLVEMIIVLLILSILAAISIPALLGYIDRARTNNDILDARSCMQAVQAELTSLYAFALSGEQEKTGEGIGSYGQENQHQASAFPGCPGVNNNGDVEVCKDNPELAQRILKTAGDEPPYIFIVGLGSRKKYESEGDLKTAYKCYVCMYMKTKDSRPIFYNGRQWTTKYPSNKDDAIHENIFGSNNWLKSEKITIQYYMLADGNGKYSVKGNSVWKFIENQVRKYN